MNKILIGERFGRLTVISRVGQNQYKKTIWLCKCECGGSRSVIAGDLKSGNTESCGCIKTRGLLERFVTHGCTNHPLYNTWKMMKSRCENKRSAGYSYYGGRGIVVSERWQSVQNFIEDMYPSFVEHLEKHGKGNTSLDRIDGSRGYEKSNCRWATKKEQVSNRDSKSRKMSQETKLKISRSKIGRKRPDVAIRNTFLKRKIVSNSVNSSGGL